MSKFQIPKHHKDKMVATVFKCILLGIDKLTKRYRCYCPVTKKVIISKNVTIEKSSLEKNNLKGKERKGKTISPTGTLTPKVP
jgi:hypothetical protein